MRTLGLGAAVRSFNDLAVPGMGGVWFGKQLFIATLGVALAERARATGRQFRNIEVANAVEALACWLALDRNGWQSDPRLLGRLKMQGKIDVSFRNVRQRGFYVTQPMRMRTVQPLIELGLVESTSERFNAFTCTDIAKAFIEIACEHYRPKNRTILNNLLCWVQNDDDCVKTDHSREALSPIHALRKEAREILRERLVTGSNRRRTLLDWMDDLQKAPEQGIAWNRKPSRIADDHWRDIKAGALFFRARDSAIEALDSTERRIGNTSDQRLSLARNFPGDIKKRLRALQESSQLFLNEAHDPSPGMLATSFCRECNQQDLATILKTLVMRDGRVLQLRGDTIGPGPAFRGVAMQAAEEDVGGDTEDPGMPTNVRWPEGISVRVQNLFLFNADLSGHLDRWLVAPNGNRSVING